MPSAPLAPPGAKADAGPPAHSEPVSGKAYSTAFTVTATAGNLRRSIISELPFSALRIHQTPTYKLPAKPIWSESQEQIRARSGSGGISPERVLPIRLPHPAPAVRFVLPGIPVPFGPHTAGTPKPPPCQPRAALSMMPYSLCSLITPVTTVIGGLCCIPPLCTVNEDA